MSSFVSCQLMMGRDDKTIVEFKVPTSRDEAHWLPSVNS